MSLRFIAVVVLSVVHLFSLLFSIPYLLFHTYSIPYMFFYIVPFYGSNTICFTISGYLDCFHFGAITNNAATDMMYIRSVGAYVQTRQQILFVQMESWSQ